MIFDRKGRVCNRNNARQSLYLFRKGKWYFAILNFLWANIRRITELLYVLFAIML